MRRLGARQAIGREVVTGREKCLLGLRPGDFQSISAGMPKRKQSTIIIEIIKFFPFLIRQFSVFLPAASCSTPPQSHIPKWQCDQYVLVSSAEGLERLYFTVIQDVPLYYCNCECFFAIGVYNLIKSNPRGLELEC
jgi:hypothetical protein